MLNEPKLEYRTAQPYVAIRSQVALRDLPITLPPLLDEVFAWMSARGLSMTGAPIWRYLDGSNMTNMADAVMTVDVGVPVAGSPAGDGRVIVDTLPAGRYAVILYTGDYSGVADAHGALLDWCARSGTPLQQQVNGGDEKWGARVEAYITDPGVQPDSSKWKTEVAFLTA